MIAEVYVDLALPKIDKPFDYFVPDHLNEIIMPGMRVVVPFGARKLIGFVFNLKSSSNFLTLKPINSILDLSPVLDTELLLLGQEIAKTTICSTITAYLAMLPAALKGEYKKSVIICEGKSIHGSPFSIQVLFKNKKEIDWDIALSSGALPEIKKEIAAGILEVVYDVKGRERVKIKKVLSLIGSHDALLDYKQNLRRGSKAQHSVIDYFLEKKIQKVELSLLQSSLQLSSNSSVSTLIKKGIFNLLDVEYYRLNSDGIEEKSIPLKLTREQYEVLKPIKTAILQEVNTTFLLFGVTGSGKTEIYLQAIAKALKNRKQAIVLVPEIALTPQMTTRFKNRFGKSVAVLHSGLSKGERYDEWRKIYRKEVDVVVGARSAIFAPFKNIGIIIIDEEHESAYKQEEMPRYHAREIAEKRIQYHKCPLILGSATPLLESFARAKKGIYQLLSLPNRINKKKLPQVTVIDMKQELQAGNRSMFSEELKNKITDRIAKKEQIILLLNRRGYSTFVLCRECGLVINCPNCNVSLTYHQVKNIMKCHYCDFEVNRPDVCPNCQSEHIRFFGTGTQKVESEVNKYFPAATILRMDVDTTRKKGTHEQILRQFEEGKADILLGTQMIAKGLDFPNVTLVGVLAADSTLHIADFRSAERTFQLLTQVAGRCGRHNLAGEVVVQTYSSDHYSILLAAEHNYEQFFQKEMSMRRKAAFPPYTYLVLITIAHVEQTIALEHAHFITNYLQNNLSENSFCYGPMPAPISKINNRFRYQCHIKYRFEPKLQETLLYLYFQLIPKKAKLLVHVSIDINPNTSM